MLEVWKHETVHIYETIQALQQVVHGRRMRFACDIEG